MANEMQAGDGHFPNTQWTLIARLKSEDAGTARHALEDLCRQYHYPLYCYIRRRGLTHHDAQDALHDFLAKLLRLGTFAAADAEKGHLRAFLSTALHRFLINWHEGRVRQRQEVSVDAEHFTAEDETRFLREKFSDEDTPDRVFERKWAKELLRRVMKQLGENYDARGKSALFKVLKPVLLRGGSLRGETPAALAGSLGIEEGALRTALSRLLGHYREALEKEVRQTVARDEDVAEELTYLRQLFGGK
jgi:DNA-directed RNA polymerase specialized sigma24 family protein